MFDIGQVCIKIAGRDAGKKCVIVQKVDEQTVLVDGQTRRRNCNLRHLEPTSESVTLKDGADHEAVKKALEAINVQVRDTKPKQLTEKPHKVKKQSAPKEEKKPKKQVKKPAKKEASAKDEPAKEQPAAKDVSEDSSADEKKE